MAGEFGSMEWITAPFQDTMKEVNRVTDKATMYGLRAVGRKGISVGRSNAPVYKGPDRVGVISGELKKSISNSRQLNHLGTGDYSMLMGPLGTKKKGTRTAYAGQRNTAGRKGAYTQRFAQRTYKPHLKTDRTDSLYGVPLYRKAIGAKTGFMDTAFSAMNGVAKETFEAAYAKAYERFK